MRTGLSRALLAVASGGAALAAGLYLFRARLFPEEVAPRETWSDVDARLEERAAEGGAAGGPVVGPVVRCELSEVDARFLFPLIERDTFVYDSRAYFAREPNLDFEMGELRGESGLTVRYVTNSLGMRERGEPAGERPDLRVLVTGDSHTDGVCALEESFANVLEARLAELHPGRSIEVLNAGCGGYTFFNYLGVLERFLSLRPHVFVMAVFGGNDFEESIRVQHWFARTAFHKPPPSFYQRKKEVEREVPRGLAFTSQDLSQPLFFQELPAETVTALRAATEVTEEVVRVCRENGIAPVVVYLPPIVDAQPDLCREGLEQARAILELDPASLAITDELADRWLKRAAQAGAAVVDLRPAMRASAGRLYHDFDHHIDAAGHRAVAEALLSVVEGLGFPDG